MDQKLSMGMEQPTTQLNANNSTNQTSSHLQVNEPYLGVWIRGNDERGYIATYGEYLIIGAHETKEHIQTMLDNPNIGTIIALFMAMNEQAKVLIKTMEKYEQQSNSTSPEPINATDTAFNE